MDKVMHVRKICMTPHTNDLTTAFAAVQKARADTLSVSRTVDGDTGCSVPNFAG